MDPRIVFIDGDFNGEIIADSDADGTGVFWGDVTVTGRFNGDICDANLRLGASLPSNVHLTFGLGGTICGKSPPKNRYVLFRPFAGTDAVAYRVNRTAPGATVTAGWVNTPVQISPGEYVADVSATAVCRVWTETSVNVGDCEIIPAATYAISWTTDGINFSPPFNVSTIAQPTPKFWGDTVGALGANGWEAPNRVVNVNDYLAALQKFLGLSTAPLLTWVDVQGVSSTDPCLNHTANFADVFLIIKAFQGESYPFYQCSNGKTCSSLGAECPTTPGDVLGSGTCMLPGANSCPPCSATVGGPCWTGFAGAPGPGGGGPEGFGPEGFGPEGFGPESGSSVAFDLEVAPYQTQAGQTATVEVYVTGSANLGAFETALALTPASGTVGTLTLESLTINSARTDYTFNGLSTISGVNLADGKAGAALGSGSGTDITGPDYLSTYTYRASNDASGVWEVRVSDPETATGGAYLLDGEAVNLAAGLGDPKLIRVGVECTLDIHCDDLDGCTTDTCTNGVCVHVPVVCNDGNLCTTDACVAGACQYTPITCNDGNTCTSDACVAGVCVYTNLPNGTLCDDGLFCTKTDKCNAVGVCVGGTKTPCTSGQVCCEDGDVCLPPGEPCIPQ